MKVVEKCKSKTKEPIYKYEEPCVCVPGVCEGNVDPWLDGENVGWEEGSTLGHAAAVVHVHPLHKGINISK